MKIVYVYDALAIWGGIERVIIEKMNYLADVYGYDVFVLTMNQGDHPVPFKLSSKICHEDLNIQTHHQYRYKGFLRYKERYVRQRLLKNRLRAAMEQIGPDIIVSTTLYASEIVSLKGEVPWVVESHTGCDHVLKYEQISWIRRLEALINYRKLNASEVLVSLSSRDTAKWKQLHHDVLLIPNIVHLNTSGHYSTGENKRVIFVGRFCRQKAVFDLLRIWDLVHQRYPDWNLSLYGEGEYKDILTEKVGSMNANVNVYPPTSEIFTRYIDSSIFVLTSLYEPFGLVIPEAMSCGLPVVSFEGDGPCDIITDGKDGFVVRDRNIVAFADRVCQLIEDKELRTKMGQQAIHSSQRYTAERIMPMWKELFNSLVQSQV
jgi:glycosyltransferase involved in cell wall biosynthesis